MSRVRHPNATVSKRRGKIRVYARGARFPAWLLLAVPFILIMIPLFQAARTKVKWLACGATVLVFEILMMVVEHNSIVREHWIYNENRILGPLVWGIPIEEPLIYYFFPPVFAILLFELITGLFDGTVELPKVTDILRTTAFRRASFSRNG